MKKIGAIGAESLTGGRVRLRPQVLEIESRYNKNYKTVEYNAEHQLHYLSSTISHHLAYFVNSNSMHA